MLAQVERAVCGVEAVLASLDPDALDGCLAARYVEEFARLERLAAAGKTLAARRVVATRAWTHDGAHRDAAGWMAATSGTTIGQASALLETAGRLDQLGGTEAALRAGELSSVQAAAIADAAAADPRAEAALLEHAAVDGVKGLRDECARVKAAARVDEHEHHRRIHEQRSLRSFTDHEGAGRIEIRGPIDATARVMAALEPFEREQFELARQSGEEPREHTTAFDAMVAMATARSAAGAGCPEEAGAVRPADAWRPSTTVNVRVDHGALRRGHTVPGEACEIAGAGPIPVAVAQRLLDDCLLRVLLVDRTGVLSVSSTRRTVPSRVRVALEDRQQECVIAGCHVDRHLEIDHNIPLESGGRTELANLNRLCGFHHRYKHEHDLRLEGPGSQMCFVGPDRAPPLPEPP